MKTPYVPRHAECAFCKKTYLVPRYKRTSLFCSNDCHNKSQAAVARKDITCIKCGTLFSAKRDHGRWPKFCTRTCMVEGALKPEWRTCLTCDGVFLAKPTGHRVLAKYCSQKCAKAGLISPDRETRECLCCGKSFELRPSAAKQRADKGCCSNECRLKFYTRERSKEWEGGRYINTTTNKVYVYFEIPGRTSKYYAEHRVVAAKAIGRLLHQTENILHINKNGLDNRPENLFVCGSISEMRKRVTGLWAWPKASNLDTWK